MKKIAILTLIVLSLIASVAFAGYETVTFTVVSSEVRQIKSGDNAGNDYVRMIGQHEVTHDGVKFMDESALTFWGKDVEIGRALTPGETITVVTQPKEFNGRTNYTFKEMLKK